MFRTSAFFAIGLLAALAVGWTGFPRSLYSRQEQPLAFRHKTHAEKSGTAQCGDCHGLREDGSFAGIPKTASCATCHGERMGSTAAEAKLVDAYVKPGRETPWLVYANQPSNVRFSHAIHTRRAKLQCAECHGAQGASDAVPMYEQNRVSGYSRQTMSMSRCERCHRDRKVQAGCLGCHE